MGPLENKISILIIDDNPGDRRLLEESLQHTYLSIDHIATAATIAEGIDQLKKRPFSLVFLDLCLPDSNGLESYLALCKINSKVPVVILSGVSDTALSLKSISLGAQDFLTKGSYNAHSLEKSVWYSIERKKNIELLKENNERYDIISKATNDIIWDWDLQLDKVKWIGQGLKNYLPANIPEAEVPYKFWSNGLHPDERKKVIGSVHTTIRNGSNSWEADYRFLKNDGSYAYINSRAYVVKNDEQKAVRIIGAMQDITDRKNAELETQKARIEAEEARKTQEEFLANMSHEIRTPMNGVIGMTQLLAGTALGKDQEEYVKTIQESATNLMVIIDDILDLTRIVAGKINIVKSDYVFNDVVSNCIKINQCRAAQKGILLKSNIDKKIHGVLSGDPGRLTQILINLVGNAVKFTDKGEVNVDAKLLEEDRQSVQIEFSIEDTGIGIAEDKVGSVFERFMQVSGDNTRKYGGAGLGLTITRQLIELQGGSIRVKSEQNKGSIFTFQLTIQKGRLKECPEKSAAIDLPGHSMADVKILLVEDNLINQKVAFRILTSQGASVDIANNGKEAIEILLKKRFDLILMDIQMPEMDGYETTRVIRNAMNRKLSQTPIIAMTASALITDREKCILAGMNDYISKPFRIQELFEKIHFQLSLAASA